MSKIDTKLGERHSFKIKYRFQVFVPKRQILPFKAVMRIIRSVLTCFKRAVHQFPHTRRRVVVIGYKKVTKAVEEITSVKCDKCGKEYEAKDLEVQEFHHISFCGGYSSVFGDGTQVECDICQHCLYEMIGDFCRCKE